VLVKFLDVTIGGLTMGGLYALIALGLSLQWGVTRVLNIAHGEFLMLGAFSAYFLYSLLGISPLLSLVITAPIFLWIGFLLHKLLFRRLLRTTESMGAYEIASVLVAYGLMFVLSNAASLGFGPRLRAYSYLAQPVTFFGATFAANRLVTLGFSVGICIILYLFLARTRLGKAIRAAAEDMNTAQLMGINIYWVLGISFGLGTMLAAMGGVLVSMMFPVASFMGFPYLIIAFIVVVLGGMGNILGSLIGGIILGLVGSITTSFYPGLGMVAFYVLFVIILLVKPTGIFGKLGT
jgi:branched-chain amino acid transport system permease protein